MMVIQGIQSGDATRTVRIFPADRCTWVQQDNTGSGYGIDNAQFYRGGTDTPVGITGAQLGFIGKSGRFVEIAS